MSILLYSSILFSLCFVDISDEQDESSSEDILIFKETRTRGKEVLSNVSRKRKRNGGMCTFFVQYALRHLQLTLQYFIGENNDNTVITLIPKDCIVGKKINIVFGVFSCFSFVFAYVYNEQEELDETFCEDHLILKDARTCTPKETVNAGVKEVPSSSSWKRKRKAGMFYTLHFDVCIDVKVFRVQVNTGILCYSDSSFA